MEMIIRLMAELEELRRRQEGLVAQLHAQNKQTKAHEQGVAASDKHGEQLEVMRRRTSVRWHVFSATPVPAVAAPTTAPAVAGVQVVYGYQEVSKSPSFNGRTKVQDQRAPLSAFFDPLSVECIAYWEIGKASHELTEEDWKVFFLGAKDCDQAVLLDASFDSGADQSVVPPATLAKLKKQGHNVLVTKLKTPIKVKGFVGPAHTVTEEATMDLRFVTDAGPLMLTNVKCWVPTSVTSCCVLHRCDRHGRRDLAQRGRAGRADELVDDLVEEEEELLPLEMDSCFPDMVAVDAAAETAKVKVVLDAKVVEDVTAGCGSEFAAKLAALLDKYVDVFRLSLRRDPPVKMPPLKVHLANGARPIRCKARRYSLSQREFMQQHVKELEAA
ncbi:hypothetical protein DYB31_015323, partial [Aphanomyces astaci]